MTLAIMAQGVENPANLSRIDEAARLLGASRTDEVVGRLIAVENAHGAASVYGRRPLRDSATLAVGNERRGLSSKTLARADEVIAIPTASRTVNTLNVAAAAAVAGWYVLRGSGAQALSTRPDARRPSLLIIGKDHVEVGSSLRSAAAFGFRDVLLDDRGAGWFNGSSSVRREAYAAARRHKNTLRVHSAMIGQAAGFDEIVVVLAHGQGRELQRQPLARGPRQLVIVGAEASDLPAPGDDRVRLATLELVGTEVAPLRLVSSIALAEIARQVGRAKRIPSRPSVRPPKYERALSLTPFGDVIVIAASDLLRY